MLGKQRKRRALEELRAGALRAIYCMEHRDGPREDLNPHSQHPALTPYALSSMLVGVTFDHIAHMIYAGYPERVETRRNWTVWELEHAGYPDLARAVADEVNAQRADSPS